LRGFHLLFPVKSRRLSDSQNGKCCSVRSGPDITASAASAGGIPIRWRKGNRLRAPLFTLPDDKSSSYAAYCAYIAEKTVRLCATTIADDAIFQPVLPH
jgi:hypothetical protein